MNVMTLAFLAFFLFWDKLQYHILVQELLHLHGFLLPGSEKCPLPSMCCFIYILDSSNSSLFTFDLVSSLLALEATEPVSEPVTQMAVELIYIHLISIQQKRTYILFDVKTTTNKF